MSFFYLLSILFAFISIYYLLSTKGFIRGFFPSLFMLLSVLIPFGSFFFFLALVTSGIAFRSSQEQYRKDTKRKVQTFERRQRKAGRPAPPPKPIPIDTKDLPWGFNPFTSSMQKDTLAHLNDWQDAHETT